MRRIMTGLLLAASIGLAGCANLPGGGTALPSPTDISGTITRVQEITRQVCSFVPTAQTVASILSALGVPGVSIASDVAGQICAAVTKVSARRGAAPPTVAGVRVRGQFVR